MMISPENPETERAVDESAEIINWLGDIFKKKKKIEELLSRGGVARVAAVLGTEAKFGIKGDESDINWRLEK